MRSRLFAPLALIAALTGCDGSLAVRGLVQAPDGLPVPEAQASLHRLAVDHGSAVLLGRSNKVGCFILSSLGPPFHREYFVVISKPGFKPILVAIKSNLNNYVTVTLAPENQPGPSQAHYISAGLGQPLPDVPCSQYPRDFPQ